MLPTFGVELPTGSELSGGTLTANLAVTGPAAATTIAGPIEIDNTTLQGSIIGSRIQGLNLFKSGGGTQIQTLRTTVNSSSADHAVQQHLWQPASDWYRNRKRHCLSSEALDFKMVATLSSNNAVGAVTNQAAKLSPASSAAFSIQLPNPRPTPTREFLSPSPEPRPVRPSAPIWAPCSSDFRWVCSHDSSGFRCFCRRIRPCHLRVSSEAHNGIQTGLRPALLERTPSALSALLRGLPDAWISCNEGENTWTPVDMVAHCSTPNTSTGCPARDRFLNRANPTLRAIQTLRPSHRAPAKSLAQLLDEFAHLRSAFSGTARS